MSDWPRIVWPHLVTVHSWSLECSGNDLVAQNLAFIGTTSAAYPAANRAFYLPFTLDQAIIVVQLFCYNGATVSGNVDVGIYDEIGTRIVSAGSTAQTATNVLQAFDITDTQIGPGQFYLALSCDNTTATFFRSSVSSGARVAGCFQQNTAFALPATATFAAFGTFYYPAFGLSTRTVL